MHYSTRLYGAPYGRDGERGNDTDRPHTEAMRALHRGQRMDCFDAHADPEQERPLKRFACYDEDAVEEESVRTPEMEYTTGLDGAIESIRPALPGPGKYEWLQRYGERWGWWVKIGE